jgi:predicted transcriptional regulator
MSTQEITKTEAVLRILRENPTLSRMEIQAKAFVTAKQLSEILDELKSKGLVSVEESRYPEFGGTISTTYKGLRNL